MPYTRWSADDITLIQCKGARPCAYARVCKALLNLTCPAVQMLVLHAAKSVAKSAQLQVKADERHQSWQSV